MDNYKRNVPKHKIKDFGTIFFVMIFFPYIINLVFHGISPEKIEKEILNDTIVVVATDIGYEKIPLEEYLIGALAASIDCSYEEEALKAQTILLRTEIINVRMKNTKEEDNDKNKKNEVLQENVKQSYLTVADMQERYGEDFKESYIRLKSIVEATDNIILTYQGSPIEPSFFAISAGSTRNGEEAFGNRNYPYLQSAKCENDILSENYMHKYSFTWEQIEEALLDKGEREEVGNEASEDKDDVSGNGISQNGISDNRISGNEISGNEVLESEEMSIEIEKIDSVGYALFVRAGGKVFSGEEFRKKLHLSSSNMTIEESESVVKIQTKGLGHGVGMSQYAANHMAKNGSDFIAILSYFFTDAEIDKN